MKPSEQAKDLLPAAPSLRPADERERGRERGEGHQLRLVDCRRPLYCTSCPAFLKGAKRDDS